MTNTIANTSISMTTIDFLNNIVNPARIEAGQKAVENRHFIARVEDECDDLPAVKLFRLALPQGGYNEIKGYELNHDQMMVVGMRESKAVRKAVLAKIKELTAENQMLVDGMKEIAKTETVEAAHNIAQICLVRREFLRNTYKGEFTQTITEAFKKRTSGGGRSEGEAIMNHARLVSILATGMTPAVFKKEFGMNPRDYGLANSDADLLDALNREEGKVVALSTAGFSYTEIKTMLVKD